MATASLTSHHLATAAADSSRLARPGACVPVPSDSRREPDSCAMRTSVALDQLHFGRLVIAQMLSVDGANRTLLLKQVAEPWVRTVSLDQHLGKEPFRQVRLGGPPNHHSGRQILVASCRARRKFLASHLGGELEAAQPPTSALTSAPAQPRFSNPPEPGESHVAWRAAPRRFRPSCVASTAGLGWPIRAASRMWYA